jgi:hypothetical protein
MSRTSRAFSAAILTRPSLDAGRSKVSATRHPSSGDAIFGGAVARGWSPRTASEESLQPGKPELRIGKPDDGFEVEAERAADAVAGDRTPASSAANRPTTALSKTPLRVQARAVSGATPEPSAALPQQMAEAAPEARPLPTAQRSFYEERLGHDFSAVRIHAGSTAAAAAASVRAQAFTHGQDVYFGANYYRPESPAGQRLIAHELAHTVQQRPNVIARRALDDAPSDDQPDGAAARARSADDDGPPSAVAGQIGANLDDDKTDTSGNARERLSQLSPASRRRAAAALLERGPNDPSQGEKPNVVAVRPARPAMPDAGMPSEQNRPDDRRREQRPGTPQARADQSAVAKARPSTVASGATPTPASSPVPPPSVAMPAAPQTESKPAPSERAEASGPPDTRRQPAPARSSLQSPAHQGAPGGGATSGAVGGPGGDDRPLRLADLFEQRSEANPSEANPSAAKPSGEMAPAAAASARPSLAPAEQTADAGPGALVGSELEPGMDTATTGEAAAATMEALASDLGTALAAIQQDLKTQSTTARAKVRQQAASARVGIRAEVRQAIEKIQAGQTSLLSELSSRVAATHDLIIASLAMRKSEVVADGLASQKTIKDIFGGHRQSVEKTVKDKTTAADALRDKKGDTVRQRNRTDMGTAMKMGDAKSRRYSNTERGSYIGMAAYDVADATATKMGEQEPDLVAAIKENTEPLAAYFRDQGTQALDGFDVNLPKILESVDDGAAKTHADQDKRAGEAHAQLDAMANQARSEIGSTALEAIAQAAAFGPQLESRLDGELGRVLKSLADAPGEVMRRISPPIEEAMTLFRTGEKPDVDAAKTLTDGLKGFMSESAASAAETMRHAAEVSSERFQGIHGGARQAMHAQVERTNKVWDGARAGFTTTTGALHAGFDGAAAGSASIMRETLTGIENNIRDQLSPVVDQLGASFDATLRDAEQKIDQRIEEGLSKNTEALTDLRDSMEEAAEQAAYEYDHPVLSSIGAGLEFLAGIVVGILAVLAVVAIFLLVGWIIASVLGISMLAAGILMMVGMAAFAIGYSFGARLAAGQGVGEAFVGAVGDFGRSVPGMLYDMTGIPKLRKAFSDEPMTPYQRGKLLGEGGTELVLAIFMVRGAAKGIASSFRNLPRFRPPVIAPEIAAAPELVAPRAPPAVTAPAAEPRIGLPGEGVVEPRPPGAPPQAEPRIGFGNEGVRAAEPRPPGAPPQAEPRIGFGNEGVRAAEPRPPGAPPQAEPRIGFGNEGVRAAQPRPPGAPPQAEPRIGFGNEGVRAAQPRPPGAPPQAEPRIGFGNEGVRAAQPRPPGAPPQAEPRIGFGREGVRAAEPRPPAVEAPAGGPSNAPLNLRGRVIESGRPGASEPIGGNEPIRAGGRSSFEPKASIESGGGPKPAGGTLEPSPLEEPPAMEQPASEQPALEQPEQALPDEPAPKQPEAAKPTTPAKEAEPTQKLQPDKPAEVTDEGKAPDEPTADEPASKDPAAEQKFSDLQKEVEGRKSKWDAAAKKKARLLDQMEKASRDVDKAEKELGIKKARGDWKGAKSAQESVDAAKAKDADLRSKFKQAAAEERDLGREYSKKARELELLDLRLHPEERSSLPCFAADTPVWSAAGPRPICSLAPGDMVRALDLASKTVVLRRIGAVFVNKTVHFYDIRLGGELIRATARHRFWVPDDCEWVEAKELDVGTRLLHWDGLCKEVEEIVYHDVPVTPTYNLSVAEQSNYFVGPGVLVHNDGTVPSYSFGDNIIYEGTNADFPGKTYIGRTNDRDIREGAHQREAAKNLERTDLTDQERDFWKFKENMKIEPRVRGLNDEQAAYMEQKNINIELKVNRENLMNRDLQPVSEKRMLKLEKSIANDPAVREGGFCPK